MKTYHNIAGYTGRYSELKAKGLSIGFVPTMGALHAGHLSLIRSSRKDNDITVCSIYVNPTQFNDKGDFEKYPRLLEDDIAELESCDCDILFAPESEEMYPSDTGGNGHSDLELGTLLEVMEGQFRPGHFAGVLTIVEKLFRIIKPDRAYFGQKDYQQLVVVRSMNEKLNLPIEIIGCPTIRETNGLALSSRNLLLTDEQRAEASAIYRSLEKGKERLKQLDVERFKQIVIDEIDSRSNLSVEYVEIADSRSLQPIDKWSSTDSAVCCVAVRAGDVRLIDNIILYN
ncbi:MAG: pantoate--beta-alanine ligase [Flavobacteriales bacterium]|nr:pantoate--beta-alanine ligase [Flavobacteriales bacterium]